MKNTTLLLLLIILVTTSINCKKDTDSKPDNPYGLPNATRTGANTFAYLKNGVPQIAKSGIYTMAGNVTNDTLAISASSGDANYFERIGITIRGNLQEGMMYQIDNPAPGYRIIGMSTNKNCLGYLGSNVINSYSTIGSVVLTKLDKTNKIISGTFNCKMPIPNCDTLNITEGRFDIKYY